MNLLIETQEDIRKSGHTPFDIIFIGSEESGHQCTWEEFCSLADKEYDAGFGAQEVAADLIIVFADGQKLWREEYDGSERWAYSAPFKKPETSLPIRHLFGTYWPTLKDLHSNNARDIAHQQPR